jgi:hypothetical protein
MVLSTALFDKPPFKNLVCNGLVLAADGKKMSKRLKNYPVGGVARGFVFLGWEGWGRGVMLWVRFVATVHEWPCLGECGVQDMGNRQCITPGTVQSQDRAPIAVCVFVSLHRIQPRCASLCLGGAYLGGKHHHHLVLPNPQAACGSVAAAGVLLAAPKPGSCT